MRIFVSFDHSIVEIVVDLWFSNSLMIHKEKTKEITTLKDGRGTE